MIQRHELEIHSLHRGPQHPILLQRRPPRALQLLLGIAPLHDRHARQETPQVGGREDRLVGQDTRRYGEIGAGGEVDAAREEGEPGCGCGAEDCCLEVYLVNVL